MNKPGFPLKRHCRKQLTLKMLLFFSSSLVFFCGCTLGPDYQSPEIALPEEWEEALLQPPLPQPGSELQYLIKLQDETLNQLLALGLSENLELQEAVLRVQEASALYRVERAAFFPDVSALGELRTTRRSEAVSSAQSETSSEFYSLGGLLSWELDIFGRVKRLTQAAEAQAAAAQEAVHGVMVSLQAEIALAYTLVRTLQREMELTRKNIRAQSDSLGLARDRFQAGVAPELDVRQAESNLGETEAVLPQLKIQLEQQIHRLAVLVGEYPEEIKPLLTNAVPIPNVPKVERAALPLNVLRQRPDLRQVERELAAEYARIGAAQAALYPIVTLPGTVSFEAVDAAKDILQASSLAYSIGPRISLSVFDFGRRSELVDAQEFRAEQAKKRYLQQVLVAVREVEDAIVRYNEQQRRKIFLERSVKASKRATSLVKSLYISGLTDFQNVLDSERRLFSQEISLAETTGEVVQAYISLYRALGGGWRDPEIPPAPINN